LETTGAIPAQDFIGKCSSKAAGACAGFSKRSFHYISVHTLRSQEWFRIILGALSQRYFKILAV